MPIRFRSPFLALALLTTLAPVRASSTNDAAAVAATNAEEAKLLYSHANDYLSHISEGDYSYAYIQFYWKRAQANLERILRVYPDTPTARALKANELKIGPYPLGYFAERVLYRLEEKRIAADNPENCAIFLAETRGAVWDDARRDAALRIIEVLCRQKRWNEAMKFPIPDRDLPLKRETILRVAARFEQDNLVKQFINVTPAAELPRAHAIQGEALALRGRARKEIAALLDRDPADVVKLEILSGMIKREVKIQRTAALRLPMQNIVLEGDVLKRPEVRDDVASVAKTFFPAGNRNADILLASYRAALGERPAEDAAAETHLAYLGYLVAFEKFDELARYVHALPVAIRTPAELKAIELCAQAGRMPEVARYRAAYDKESGASSDAAELAQFRGQMNSSEIPLTVHEKTLSNLPIKDPCILAQAIMEWSLTPNRSIRGAAPYDSVVQKFGPGFENLPPPKSTAVRDAASASKPY